MQVLAGKLLERQRQDEADERARITGGPQDVSFGSQIRNYVLHPYQMVERPAYRRRDRQYGRGARRRHRRVHGRRDPLAARPRGVAPPLHHAASGFGDALVGSSWPFVAVWEVAHGPSHQPPAGGRTDRRRPADPPVRRWDGERDVPRGGEWRGRLRPDRPQFRRQLRADVHRQRLPRHPGAGGRPGVRRWARCRRRPSSPASTPSRPARCSSGRTCPTWSTLTFTDGAATFAPGTGTLSGWRQSSTCTPASSRPRRCGPRPTGTAPACATTSSPTGPARTPPRCACS